MSRTCAGSAKPTTPEVTTPCGNCHSSDSTSAVQLILKSLSFLLEFADYGLHQHVHNAGVLAI
jgi:hypothetical protein